MDRDCANCDHSGNSLGGRCCWDPDDEPEKSNKTAASLRLYTESEVKVLVDTSVEQYIRKCDEYKNEMLKMMQAAKRQDGLND